MGKSTTPKWINENVPTEIVASELFVFSVKLPNGKTVMVNLLQDIDIELDMLEDQLETIPAQYIFWAAIYSELKSSVTLMESRIGICRATVTKETLEAFRQNGVKLTDKQLGNLLGQDEKLNRLEVKLAIAQKKTGKVYHMVEAIRIRSEHCRSLAGFKRQEREQSAQQT